MSALTQPEKENKRSLDGYREGGGGVSRQPRSKGGCDLRGPRVDVIGQETVRRLLLRSGSRRKTEVNPAQTTQELDFPTLEPLVLQSHFEALRLSYWASPFVSA